ncbi:hypothetical protein TNCV_2549981 [Trichonephila clavipes]|nr:hypothetical protein TNCV_2549981 [Trichonephila clavipes]
MGRVHSKRMSPERTALKIFIATRSNKRSKGRPNRRWKDCVDDIQKVKNWTSIASIARRRSEWQKLPRKAQAPKGPTCQCC